MRIRPLESWNTASADSISWLRFRRMKLGVMNYVAPKSRCPKNDVALCKPQFRITQANTHQMTDKK